MDCASCVAKIETALTRLPGVSDIRSSFSAETISLVLDPATKTSTADVMSRVRSLGYGAEILDVLPATRGRASAEHPHDSNSHHHEHHHGHEGGCCDGHDHASPGPAMEEPSRPEAGTVAAGTEPRWFETRKGRLVLGLGTLMALAYGVAQFLPAHAAWIFVAAVLIGVAPFARQAFALARAGSPFSIEMLMSVAAIGALAIGEAEEAAAVVFLFAVGEFLEGVAAGRARAGIKALASLVPKAALLVETDGTTRQVPAQQLRIGDIVLVRPGDRVPADGDITEGTSSLDESPVTGESMPLPKSIGERVFAGSINADGALRVLVAKDAADNTIARIIQLVEEAQASKAPTARFIENFSRYYTPAVMLIAALTILLPPVLLGADWYTWFYRGLALLLIACPCALVLSVPAAIASGLAVGTRRGLLIKGGNALETIGRITAIAFDKTGTLTEGRPQVTDVLPLSSLRNAEVLALASAVEAGSSHPLARAITAQAVADGIATPPASEASAVPGKAVRALVAGRRLAVGSPTHVALIASLDAAAAEQIAALEGAGKTVVVLLDEDRCEALGLIAMRDEPRGDARQGVAALKALGIRPVMLTGDNRRTARAIAEGLGLEWQAELVPGDKLRAIGGLKGGGAKVAMVGDGINDAPALAAADVGIAMGGGTDVALETADAALLKNRVLDLAHLVALSRATMGNIRQNVAVALTLKALFLVTTVLGVTGLWVAVLADTGATALVTLNALRLLRFKGPDAKPPAVLTPAHPLQTAQQAAE
jgi:Cd2+/Zn2+-exporting ATPase